VKKLNTAAITNDLEHSSFFPARPAQTPVSEPPKAPIPQPVPVKKVEPVVTPPVTKPAPIKPSPVTKPVPAAVPATAPTGRHYVRRTFDFYDDQTAYLTKASLEDRLAGKEGSMNAMVREAIDAYISARKSK